MLPAPGGPRPPSAAITNRPGGRRCTARAGRTAELSRSVGPGPLRVELTEEDRAPLLLVDLADGAGETAERVEHVEEVAVRGVTSPHVSGSARAGGTELVEPAVVADAGVRVPLDVVAGELRSAPARRRNAGARQRPPRPPPAGRVPARGEPQRARPTTRPAGATGRSPAALPTVRRERRSRP